VYKTIRYSQPVNINAKLRTDHFKINTILRCIAYQPLIRVNKLIPANLTVIRSRVSPGIHYTSVLFLKMIHYVYCFLCFYIEQFHAVVPHEKNAVPVWIPVSSCLNGCKKHFTTTIFNMAAPYCYSILLLIYERVQYDLLLYQYKQQRRDE
jgi:hypothetical protein